MSAKHRDWSGQQNQSGETPTVKTVGRSHASAEVMRWHQQPCFQEKDSGEVSTNGSKSDGGRDCGGKVSIMCSLSGVRTLALRGAASRAALGLQGHQRSSARPLLCPPDHTAGPGTVQSLLFLHSSPCSLEMRPCHLNQQEPFCFPWKTRTSKPLD